MFRGMSGNPQVPVHAPALFVLFDHVVGARQQCGRHGQAELVTLLPGRQYGIS
jgi:hypothetical protein